MARAPRDLTPEDRRIWARVAGSVTPPKTRKAARVTPGAAPVSESVEARPVKAPPKPQPRAKGVLPVTASVAPARAAAPAGRSLPEELEPRRQRRLSRERDPIEARIDLHGFGRFEAEDQLRGFLMAAQARGLRAVLVITGQGRRSSGTGGGGVIRASVHEWLHAPALRGVVSGFAVSHRRHGGDGAIYVTIKRR